MIEIGLAFLFFREEIGLQLHDKEKKCGSLDSSSWESLS